MLRSDGLRADGNRRTCVVEIEGERARPVLLPLPAPDEGQTRKRACPRLQRMVLELLRADVDPAREKADSELAQWCKQLGVGQSRFGSAQQPVADASHPPSWSILPPHPINPAACGRAAKSRTT